MKALSILLILAGSLTLTACDENQKPKIKNPLAGHVEALQKAKDVERLLQEATEKRLKSIEGL
jgi:uncharacterized lipoprotein YajG